MCLHKDLVNHHVGYVKAKDLKMRFEMAALSTALGLPARYFLTREKGEQAYTHLERAMSETPAGEPLVLVFPPDQIIDASFADEAVIRLAESIQTKAHDDRGLLLTGLTDDSAHNINAVIHLRNLKLALLVVDDDGTWEVVGQLERSLRETLETVSQQASMTAPQLADMLDSAVNTASNRLKRLYDGRLLRREHEVTEKGLQYSYHFWRW